MNRPKLLLCVVLALAASACGAETTSEPEDANDVESEDGRRSLARGRHRGPAGLVLGALEKVDLSEDQRDKIAKIFARPDRDRDEDRESRRESMEGIAEAVRTGDVAALKAAREEQQRVAGERTTKAANTLTELHATLNADQRRAFVAALRAELDRRGEGRGDRAGRDRRWSGPREGRPGPDRGDRRGMDRDRRPGPDRADRRGMDGDRRARPEKGDARGHGRPGGAERAPMGGFTWSLDLTEEQQASLRTAREAAGLTREPREERTDRTAARAERREAERARFDAFLTAFERDDFDASQAGFGELMGVRVRDGGGRMLQELEVLVPILTEEQRAELADRMEDRLDEGRGGRRFDRGRRPPRDADHGADPAADSAND